MKVRYLLLSLFLVSCGAKHQPATPAPVQYAAPARQRADSFSPAVQKAWLDSAFIHTIDSPAFKGSYILTALQTGHLFSSRYKDAAMRYMTVDSIVHVVVLRSTGIGWDTLLHATLPEATGVGLWPDCLTVADFNGDGIPDLKVTKDFWQNDPGEEDYLWLYKNNHFTFITGFDSIPNPAFDKKSQLLYGFEIQGCSGLDLELTMFKFEGASVKRQTSMHCNCCIEQHDSCRIEMRGKPDLIVPKKTVHRYLPAYLGAIVKNKISLEP